MNLNLIHCVKKYISGIIETSQPGYKLMLMDKETTSFISLVIGMSEIMKQEVYMFERLDQINSREDMSYLKCLVFVRPTSDNIAMLCKELQKPRYGSYYIYFSNVVSKNDVKLLAEADEQETVKEVQEIYVDFLALAPHLFSLNIEQHFEGNKFASGVLDTCIQGLSSVLFSLELMPTIRYQKNSEMCKRLADSIRMNLAKESALYPANTSRDHCLLLILDRRDDPVTPLLIPWTYEAMVHELLGCVNGRIKLGHVPGIADELKEVVMIPAQDEFYAKSSSLNYGDIGQTIKGLMEEYQQRLSKQQKVESISDMKHFVENYPQFKKMSGTVSKHVTVLGELSRIVSTYKHLELSECQQELVCGFDHNQLRQHIVNLISCTDVRESDAVNLVALYALRYENHPSNETKKFMTLLRRRKVPEALIGNISCVVEFGGQQKRQSQIFESDLPQDVSSIKRRLFKGIKGVDNVYTQHKPLLSTILNNINKGALSESLYPFVSGHQGTSQMPRPQSAVVFIVGGITHEESLAVQSFNQSNSHLKVILGGTHLHNSASFLRSVVCGLEGQPRMTFRL